MAEADGAAARAEAPRCYLVIHNVAKSRNIGNIVRSATAFGVHEVVLVGRGVYKTNMAGSFGTVKHVRIVHFRKLDMAVDYLRAEGCRILGIEIVDGAARVQDHPFHHRTALIMGNEVRPRLRV